MSLVSLPMDDVDENAAMVNALQRHATVVVQKSLREGFGLTVAEGMWKRRAVVASRVGGIIDQVSPGTGVLLDDPADLDAFGAVLVDLLGRPDEIAALGDRARRHVLDNSSATGTSSGTRRSSSGWAPTGPGGRTRPSPAGATARRAE